MLVMLPIISSSWLHLGHEVCANEVFCSAYADNWSWKTQHMRTHIRVFTVTLEFLQLFGFEIDWSKAWCWASQRSLAVSVQKLLADNLEGRIIQSLSHAKDIGFELRYSGSHRVGHRKCRYENGMQRLDRLSRLRVSLAVKEHILLSSIWSAALYGSEIAAVSTELFHKLASHAADALVGPSRSMSPAFVLALSANQVLDPGFFVILLAFGSARDWLLRQPQQVCEQFYHIVATPGDGSCKGPATALRCYLAKVDWPMNKRGYLAASLFFQIQILIKRLLTQAWFRDFAIMPTQRKSLLGLRDISRDETLEVLSSFPDVDRKHLLREIAGAFQTGQQKKHWNESGCSLCPFLPRRRFQKPSPC